MGADIHCFVEKKIGNKWKQITGFISDMYNFKSDYFSGPEFKNCETPLDLRNYGLFALLADVRNGKGFAGCDTGNRIEPISYPKGLPEDVSFEIHEKSDDYGPDGHSHSYLTAKEILEYDRNKKKIQRGLVTAEKYKDFLKTGNPYPCCGGVGGANIIHTQPEEAIKTQEENPDYTVYCQIEWEEKVNDFASVLFDHVLPQLLDRCESPEYDDVRIVFWFDN